MSDDAPDISEPVYLTLAEAPNDYDIYSVDPKDEGNDSARHLAEQAGTPFPDPPPTVQVGAKRRGAKVVPYRGRLNTGNYVRAVKRAMAHAGVIKWDKFTPVKGPFFYRAMVKFKKKHGLPVTGKTRLTYTPEMHKKLAPYFDDYSLKHLWKARVRPKSKAEHMREQKVADAYLGWRNRHLMHYTQGGSRTMGWSIPYPKIIAWADCSAWDIGIEKRSGNPLWQRLGTYTGTIRQAGHWTWSPKPGDHCNYGPGTGRHVGVFVGYDSRRVAIQIGFGSESGPNKAPVRYRPDFAGYTNSYGD